MCSGDGGVSSGDSGGNGESDISEIVGSVNSGDGDIC